MSSVDPIADMGQHRPVEILSLHAQPGATELYDHSAQPNQLFVTENERSSVIQGYRASYMGKRVLDLVVSTVFLVLVASWLFPLIGLFIKVDSRGPVFFKQTRIGRNGRDFSCIKFRTMYHQSAAVFQQASKDDPRVTRMGRVLRATNLDELPQFLNVFIGSMAVVGPRPHVRDLDESYEGTVSGYRLRHLGLPGVTGLAQVMGCRGETRTRREMAHRVRWDLFYLRNQSFWLDIIIIAKTAWSMIRGGDERAY